MSDSSVSSGQVQEKLKDKVLPHLRCSKCQDFFRGQVFGCANNHTTSSLCCGVDIESGADEDVDVDGQDEEGMEVDNKDENAEEDDNKDESDDENKLDDLVCPMKDCKSKTTIHQGNNLTLIVRDLRLEVPCKNRYAGCPQNVLKMRWRNTKTNAGIEKSNVTFAARMLISRTCSITSEMHMSLIVTPRSGSWMANLNQLKKMCPFAMRAPTCLRLVPMEWFS